MVEASLVNTVQTFGILVGIVIALFQIRDMNKTRQAELYLRLWERWNTKEFSEQRYEAYRMEWTDWKDFMAKYSGSKNPTVFAAWNTFGRTITGLAELRKKKLIEIDFLDAAMINDIRNWWLGFGRLELEHWRRGRPQWRSHFPFIKEVFDYDRKTRSWLYDDETGDPSHELRPHEIWVPPEEIIQIRMKLYQ